MNLKELVSVAHANAVAKGFHDPPLSTGEMIALAHSELSEALEAFRERGHEDWYREDGKPEGIGSEMADLVIRVADMAGTLDIDLDAKVTEKVAYNAGRPFRHGGKRL